MMTRNNMTLKVIPQSWFFRHFEILDGDTTVATLKFLSTEEAQIKMGEQTLSTAREGLLNPKYLLKRGSEKLATVQVRWSATRSFELKLEGRRYLLVKDFLSSGNFTLRRGETVVGSVRREHLFTRRLLADLPTTLALETRIFVIWLTMIIRSRNSGD